MWWASGSAFQADGHGSEHNDGADHCRHGDFFAQKQSRPAKGRKGQEQVDLTDAGNAAKRQAAIVFKLSKADVDALDADGSGERLVVGKRVMKEWAVVPANQQDLCRKLTERAYRFVKNV